MMNDDMRLNDKVDVVVVVGFPLGALLFLLFLSSRREGRGRREGLKI